MKLQLRSLSVALLPAILAGSAAAQAVMILPSGSNPLAGAPVYLPGPVTGMRIELPAPRLNPGLAVSLTPASAGVFPVLPIPMIPSRPIVPVIHPTAARENVKHPLSAIVPGLRVQLDKTPTKEQNAAPEIKQTPREILEKIFDGRRDPVRTGIKIGLPEEELEKEIGAY